MLQTGFPAYGIQIYLRVHAPRAGCLKGNIFSRLQVHAPRADCLKGSSFRCVCVRILAERLSQWRMIPATENNLLPVGSRCL